MVLSKNKQFIFLLFKKTFLYKIDSQRLKVLKKIKIPENVTFVELLENGDLHLVIDNPNFDESKIPKIEEKLNKSKEESIQTNQLYSTNTFNSKKNFSEKTDLSPRNSISNNFIKNENEKNSLVDKKFHSRNQKCFYIKNNDEFELKIINSSLYKNYIVRLIVDQYHEEIPKESQHIIFQSTQEISKILTKIKIGIEKSQIPNSENESLISDDLKGFKDFDQEEKNKSEFELIVFSKDFSFIKINYSTENNMLTKENKIICQKVFDFDKLKLNFQNFSNLAESSKSKIYDQSLIKKINISQEIFSSSFLDFENDQKNEILGLGYISEKNGIYYINMIIQKKEKYISKIKAAIPSNWYLASDENFHFQIYELSKEELKLAFYSKKYLVVFDFSLISKKFINHMMKERSFLSSKKIQFSSKRKLFYIPSKNKIEIFDDQLKYNIDDIYFEREIQFIHLNDTSDLLLVSDNFYYYEIDLESLTEKRKEPCFSPQKDKFFFLMNFKKLLSGKSMDISFHYSGKKMIQVLGSKEKLELLSFPFESLLNCFGKLNRKESIREYAKYYFKSITQNKRSDYEFGSISPLNFCIYILDSALLEELLTNYFYPNRIDNYISPLEYAFIRNHQASIAKICESLIRRDEDIYLSRSDFKYLLASPLKICHKVISTILKDPKVKSIPHIMFINKPVILRSSDFLLSMGVKILREDEKKEKDQLRTSFKALDENDFSKSKYYNSGLGTISKSEIEISSCKFKYNFDIGTDDSIMFVDRYAHSESDDFILSDWKHIIRKKWSIIKLPSIFIAFLFYVFLVLVTLFVSFRIENIYLKWISLLLDFFFIFFELLRMVTYINYKPKIYFSNFFVYIDILLFIGIALYYFVDDRADKIEFKIISFVLLVFLYYKGLLYLKIFDQFTTLVGIINTIIKKVITFFMIILYSYIMIVVLAVKLDSEGDIYLKFRDAYFWTLLGGVEGEAFENRDHIFLAAVLIGSLFLTIVLLNILIAYLSNLFSRLEDQQRVSNLKQKAILILDFETIIRFFKYKITGIINLERKLEKIRYNKMIENVSVNLEQSFKKNEIRKLKSYFRNEKIIFIFKNLAKDKDEEIENAYQKLKNLEKSQEDVSSLILLKTRILEKNISKLKNEVKKNQNNQGKVIEELTDTVNDGINNVQDTVEEVKEQINQNNEEYISKFNEINKINQSIEKINSDIMKTTESLTEIKQLFLKLNENLNKK